MPDRLLHFCPGSPACPNKVARGLCPDHQVHRYQDRGHRFYKTARWARLRELVRFEQPFCWCGCGGLSADFHHVVAHQGIESRFFDRENVRGMTRNCHAKLTRAGL